MNDAEKIEKLAKWMGFPPGFVDGYYQIGPDSINDVHEWNPLENIADAWMLVKKAREDDWIVVVKEIPKDLCHVMQGAISEYDAPCDDQHIEKGKASCELECGRQNGEWRHSGFAFAETAPRAISDAVLSVIDQPAKGEEAK